MSDFAILTGLSLLLSLLTVFMPFITQLLSSKLSKSRDSAVLKSEMLKIKSELMTISAQDEFAKWAKLKRKSESLAKEYSESNSSIAMLSSVISGILTFLNWGLFLGTCVYYWDTPIFYLPPALLGPFNSWASWPISPVGSVSAFYVVGSGCFVFKKLLKGSLNIS